MKLQVIKDGMLIMVKMYIGKVTKVLPDYTINFNIPGYAELAGEGVASPAVKLAQLPIVNDQVLLIQPNDQIEIFVYFLSKQDTLGISIQNGSSYVRILPSGHVNINGHLLINPPSEE